MYKDELSPEELAERSERAKEKARARRKRFYEKNRERLVEKQKTYAAENREKIRERKRTPEARKKAREYYKANRKRILDKQAEYRDQRGTDLAEDKHFRYLYVKANTGNREAAIERKRQETLAEKVERELGREPGEIEREVSAAWRLLNSES